MPGMHVLAVRVSGVGVRHAWRQFRDFAQGDELMVTRGDSAALHEARVVTVDWLRMTLRIELPQLGSISGSEVDI